MVSAQKAAAVVASTAAIAGGGAAMQQRRPSSRTDRAGAHRGVTIHHARTRLPARPVADRAGRGDAVPVRAERTAGRDGETPPARPPADEFGSERAGAGRRSCRADGRLRPRSLAAATTARAQPRVQSVAASSCGHPPRAGGGEFGP